MSKFKPVLLACVQLLLFQRAPEICGLALLYRVIREILLHFYVILSKIYLTKRFLSAGHYFVVYYKKLHTFDVG